MPNQRKIWIDTTRGLCMLAILLHHTEMYYAKEAIIDYRLFVDNALSIFFFVSGYLFYKESTCTTFSIKRKIKSIIKTIIIPYFIFMSFIAYPKAIIHGNFHSIFEILLKILTGRESWFITALATAEIIFSLLLYLSKRNKWILTLGVAAFLITAIMMEENILTIKYNYWNIMDGCLAITFLYIGYLYHRHEAVLSNINLMSMTIVPVLMLLSKYIIVSKQIYCYWGPIDISNYIIFFTDNILAIILIITISKRLPNIKPITWMGSRALVYYFLCGGVPLILSVIAQKVGFIYEDCYLKVIFMLSLVYIFISVLTWIIYKYIPWVTGNYRWNK